MAKVYKTISLTPIQAKFLRAILLTHSIVCVPNTAAKCKAIITKLDAAVDSRTAPK